MTAPSSLQHADMHEGAIWAYRFLLDRDPTDAEINDAKVTCRSVGELIETVVAKRRGRILDPVANIDIKDPAAINMREAVIWAHRIFLRRDPLEEAHVQFHLNGMHTLQSLRQAFLLSQEFKLLPRGPVWRAAGFTDSFALDDKAVIQKFAPFATTPPPMDSFGDFMGVRTRLAYLPAAYATWAGTLSGPPGSPRGPMHDEAEWVGTLRSVLEAKDHITVVELGAGWSPWLVASAVAGRKRGINSFTLVGVEADAGHIAYSRQHFLDNGLNPDEHALHEAIVGIEDGFAYFPRIDSRTDYGAEAKFDGTGGGGMDKVKSISLKTLLAEIPIVDCLHVDIQGSEGIVLEAAAKVVAQRVRRIVIGTHSREVEAHLHRIFGDGQWHLEHDSACGMTQQPNGSVALQLDGAQVWKNKSAL